jgi:hypothetical protein
MGRRGEGGASNVGGTEGDRVAREGAKLRAPHGVEALLRVNKVN